MPRPLIWIFGNAVQDITVEVDIDSLIRDNSALISRVAVKDRILIKKGSVFKTHFNAQGLGVELLLDRDVFAAEEAPEKELYSLSPGDKYTLAGRVQDLSERPAWSDDPDGMMVHCEDISWGGGGINVCRFLRALAPKADYPSLRYTDYAMSRTFVRMIEGIENRLLHSLPVPQRKSVTVKNVAKKIADLMDKSMYEGESLISRMSRIFAAYSPENCLEVFLASIVVDPLLFRPVEPVFLRNWVFSKFHNAERSTQDKIICRSKAVKEEELGVTADALNGFLGDADHTSVGAIVLNSIKHKQLFKSGYGVYRGIYKQQRYENRNDFVGILAMTKAMQEFVPDMIASDPTFPPFILIFNEEEAVTFAKTLGCEVDPILRAPGDLPNVLHFAQIIEVIRRRFEPPFPRIYVTTGPRGSLGFDGVSQKVIQVSYYSRLGDILFDTNSCGDAYCAAITLLEWARRFHGDTLEPYPDPADEMRYFMAVATAAAYCKARDRRGRIDAKTIRGLLEDTYLGSGEIGYLDKILTHQWAPSAPWVDEEGRAHRPPTADFRGVRKTLANLLFNKNTGGGGPHSLFDA